MKRLIKFTVVLVLSLAFTLTGCREQYEKTIDNFMKEYLDDPDSYEVVSCNVYPYSFNTVVIIASLNGRDLSSKQRADTRDNILDAYKQQGKDVDEIVCNSVELEYRTKNKYGAKEKRKHYFILTKDMKEICEEYDDLDSASRHYDNYLFGLMLEENK